MPNTTPPRNVIYYSSRANSIPLGGISKLPYTDVIIGFLIATDPDNGNFDLVGDGGAFDDSLQSNIQKLTTAGKNVLISLGGEVSTPSPGNPGFPSAAWRHYAQDVGGLVDQVVSFVTTYGFSGVDIDFEDDSGFTDPDNPGAPALWDGVTFLVNLTNGLAQKLPPEQGIITHAPAPPYWDPQGGYNNAYTTIWQKAGHQITWFNNQFYNNPGYDAPANVKISKYNNIADVTGAQQQLLGAPVTAAGASDNGEGYLPVGQLINDVIAPLQTAWGKAFGGVMGFEFALDEGGAWASQIGQALGQQASGCPGESHTVVAGDTLARIAQRFLGSSDRWVDLRKPDGTPFTPEEAKDLQVGQLVCIPGEIYTVVADDTLSRIAQRFLGNGDLWVDLMKPDGTPFTPEEAKDLQVGQLVYVPGESYTVVAHDTLSRIAQRFLGNGDLWVDLRKPDGTPFTAEEAQNLQVGQLVYIPPPSTGGGPLALLEKISGTRTVAGQHNAEPNSSPAQWTNEIYDTTGRYPGLWSGDFLYEQDNIDNRPTMIAEAIDQWNQGALVHLMYHAAPPDLGEPCAWDPGVVNHPLSDDQWTRLITDGADLNNAWKARLDTISVFFQELKDNGVQVLWRPFHEMNKPMDPSVNPFWWCGRPGPTGSARLYQITHDYLVGTKGLTNLIWVWDVQDLNFDWAPYNPGDGYWDVFAMDMYGDGYTSQKYETALQVAGNQPIAIGECEILPTAHELAAQPRWTFFMAWAGLVFSDNGNVTNTAQQITDLYNAANVMTRDQMPGWG